MRVKDQNPTPAAAARRAQIVDAAIHVLADRGYANTSFARIAEHAELSSTRLISYHFADKSALMQAVVETVLDAASDFMRPHLDAASGRRATLAAFVRSNLDFIATHPAHIRSLVEIVTGSRGAEGGSITRESLTVMTRFLRDGQAEGAFRDFDPHVMAMSVRASIDATVTTPDIDHAAYADELVALFDRATRNETP